MDASFIPGQEVRVYDMPIDFLRIVLCVYGLHPYFGFIVQPPLLFPVSAHLPYISPRFSRTPPKAFSQSPQYPLTQASTSFFPFFASPPSMVPTRSHLCVSSRSQFSYSASTTSFSMRLTTRSATRRSCRCEPRFWRVRWRRRGACMEGEIGVEGLALGSVRRDVKVWWLRNC